MSDPNNGTVIVRKTIDHFKSLDVLVNNVSIHFSTHSSDKSSLESYRKTMAINCESVIKTTMEALPHLERAQGNIVFVSSIASIIPGYDSYAYRMSKAAISSYAKCLAIDIAPKIRVNIVSLELDNKIENYVNQEDRIKKSNRQPSTNNTLLSRNIGEFETITNTIFYLASDQASFVNGAELFVDGSFNPYDS